MESKEQSNFKFNMNIDEVIKTSKDFDDHAEIVRWEAFLHCIGERETVEATFEGLGYDNKSHTANVHALLKNVLTEKKCYIDHLWISSVTTTTNPQSELWKTLKEGDNIILTGIIDKYIYKSDLDKYSRLSLSYPNILSINSNRY